jgi:hypothetical protein
MVGRLRTKIAGSRIRSSVSLNSKVRHATTVVVSTVQLSFQGPSIILILPTSQSFSTRFTRAFLTKTYYNPIHISPSIRATVWTSQQFVPLQQQILLHDPRNTKLTPVQYTTQYLTFSLRPLNPAFAQIFFPETPFSDICIYVLSSTVILPKFLCVGIDRHTALLIVKKPPLVLNYEWKHTNLTNKCSLVSDIIRADH